MDNNKIVVGILGAGRIGQVHIDAMQRNPQVRIKKLVDPFISDSVAQELVTKGVQIGKSEDDIFNDDEISAVFICSPTDTHADCSLRAIAAQKHVFCEKPIDLQLSRIDEVRQALKGKSLVYQVGFNRRFDHNFNAMRTAVLNDKIGRLQMIRITSRDPAPPPLEYFKPSGGLFFDMMIHDFDMMRFQTGFEIEEIYTIGSVLVDPKIGQEGDIDSAIASCKLSNGMLGYIENCRQAVYGYDQRIEILGTKGAIEIKNDTASTSVLSTKEGIVTENPLWFFLERYKEAYEKEQQAFFKSIHNKIAAVCGVEDGFESVRIAYAAKKSMLEHRPVSLKEI